MKKDSSADELHLFRSVLRDNGISLGEIAEVSGVDLAAVIRQFGGEEPVNPRARRFALELLRHKKTDLMIRVTNILNVEGKTKLADAFTDMVNEWLDE
jgi:hypothetical protein